MADSGPQSPASRETEKSLQKDMKVVEEGGMEKVAIAESRNMSASYALDPVAERKLVWKFDTRILPVLAVMYLFNSLDKSNLGNAKTAGLEKTLHLAGDQYNIILSVFFVPCL